jgi:hypothetical protein
MPTVSVDRYKELATELASLIEDHKQLYIAFMAKAALDELNAPGPRLDLVCSNLIAILKAVMK